MCIFQSKEGKYCKFPKNCKSNIIFSYEATIFSIKEITLNFFHSFFLANVPSKHLQTLLWICQNQQNKTKQHCNYERHSGIFFDCVTRSCIPLSKHNIVIYIFLTGVISWVFSNDFLLLVRSTWWVTVNILCIFRTKHWKNALFWPDPWLVAGSMFCFPWLIAKGCLVHLDNNLPNIIIFKQLC